MRIESNQIYCIIPFYCTCGTIAVGGKLWKKQAPKIEENVFYNFIKVGGNTPDVYAPDFGRKANAPLKRFMGLTSSVTVGRTNKRTVNVKIMGEGAKSWRGPRLIVSQSGLVGMLSIPLQLPSATEISDVVDFNYAFHKYDSGQAPVLVCNGFFDTALGLNDKASDSEWTFGALIRLLLAECGELTMFNPMRAHVLTLIVGSGAELPLSVAAEDSFLRIMHCHDDKYTPVPGAFDGGNVMRTFANIYTGACTEGACVLGVLKGDGSDGFLRSYPDSNFQTRFLWLYFTALLQRHTLLDIDRRLATADADDLKADVTVRRAVADVCKSRLAASFASISTYSHINALYSFLTAGFDVTRLHDAISEKLTVLDTWLKVRDADRREYFERFIKIGGIVFASVALLYGIPQAITAVYEAIHDNLPWWTLLCMLPAVGAFIWLLLILLKKHQ